MKTYSIKTSGNVFVLRRSVTDGQIECVSDLEFAHKFATYDAARAWATKNDLQAFEIV